MKIEKLSDCSVKITLTSNDLSDFGIRYDSWDSELVAEFLLSIATEIKAQTQTDITCEKLYVEIFSRESGCLIFVSFPRKEISHKSQKCRMACMFGDYNSLREFCCLLEDEFSDIISSSSLYYSSSVLRLEIEIPGMYKDMIADSAENGYFAECSSISDGAVREYYFCAETGNAAKKIAYSR